MLAVSWCCAADRFFLLQLRKKFKSQAVIHESHDGDHVLRRQRPSAAFGVLVGD